MKKKIGIITLLMMFMAVFIMPTTSKAYEEGGFNYRVSSKKAIVTGCVQKSVSAIKVPDKLGGFPVTGIAGNAFYGLEASEVVLPDTVSSIGNDAFGKMKKLKSIKLPAKLTRIGSKAFANCSKLASVQFNRKLQDIEREAFSNCIVLRKVVLPNSLKNIERKAFAKCYKLSSVKLGSSLSKIGEQAFYKDYALKSCTIPKSVDRVGTYAFESCEDLQTVTFKNGKTKLSDGVFYNCSSLKKTYLPAKIKNVPAYTFYGCSSLKKMAVPSGVSIIKKYAFYGCKKMKSVRMNSRIYAVGDWAFAGSGLKSVKLNANMQFIGNAAFRDTDIRSLDLRSKVAFIGNRVFANCEKLKRISIPASVKGINPGAFNNCTSLQAINVSSGNSNYSSQSGVLYNKGRSKLIQYPLGKRSRSFRTPGSLQTIRSHAFSGNRYLQNVTVSSGSIGSNAFSDMLSLRRVSITGQTRTIGGSAFRNNYKLSTVVLPDSVQTIGADAFAESKVRTIHIPSRLTKLGSGAFYGCDSLVSFTGGRGSRYSVSDGVLYNGPMTKLLQYPAKKPGASFTVPNSVRKVETDAFRKASKITKLYFGSNFRCLDYNGINRAKNLKSVVFNSKKAGYSSTYGISECNKLAVIVGPNNYTMRAMADNANATLITL